MAIYRMYSRIFAFCFAFLALCTQSYAETPWNSPSDLDASFGDFRNLVEQRHREGLLPDLDNPHDAAVLLEILDPYKVVGKPPFYASDLPVLSKVLSLIATDLDIYIQAAQRTPDNRRYHDEIVRITILALHTGVASASAFQALIPKLASSMDQGKVSALIVKGRGGLRKIALGALVVLADTTLSADNRRILTQAFANLGPQLAESIQISDRQGLGGQLTTVVALTPSDLRPDLQRFANQLTIIGCNRICAEN
ncbi:hypothetical protein RB623_16600 [Mesorhizobium sp. LHD-90]|uniref:hypothetical protein n=1 Tax=Mesorhizobium sp. LHD-90 TaxID=3071414 RepID=UPI0027E0C1FD|nr:hypothetical protein [Mesorhizobium sp. LHD-90]MDQ6435680.1 hypothetical protein [Mesorhizobium sp. LHD-90]